MLDISLEQGVTVCNLTHVGFFLSLTWCHSAGEKSKKEDSVDDDNISGYVIKYFAFGTLGY